MANNLVTICDTITGVLKFNLLRDTIDVDLKIHTLNGIHAYKKDNYNLIKNVQADAWNRCAVVNTNAWMGCTDDTM